MLVENEGNARLSSSAPKIHVAVAGIEKLIPRAQDLAVFLKLLARSATGQPLSVYTSFLAGPRRDGEPDGPEEFYLVLLDNGRTEILADQRKAPIAVLHPLRSVSESLPGVSQDRRLFVSVGLFGSDRKDSDAAVHGTRTGSVACRSHPACAARAAKSVPVKIEIPKILLGTYGQEIVRRQQATARSGWRFGCLHGSCGIQSTSYRQFRWVRDMRQLPASGPAQGLAEPARPAGYCRPEVFGSLVRRSYERRDRCTAKRPSESRRPRR